MARSSLLLVAMLACGYQGLFTFVLPSISRRGLPSLVAVSLGGAAQAASSINGVDVKLYSDEVCAPQRIFENVTSPAIPLNSCEKDKSGVAVFYECTGTNKLRVRVYFRGKCDETPTIEAFPINGQCVPLPGFGSGFWSWKEGC